MLIRKSFLSLKNYIFHFSWFDQIVQTCDTTENFAGNSEERGETQTALLCIAALCNRAEFKPGQDSVPILRRECTGDASEIALLKFSELTMGKITEFRAKNPKIAEIPFNSTNKYQVSVHETDDGNKSYLLVMKGAPERILDRCTTILLNGKEEKLDDKLRQDFNTGMIIF